MARRPTALAATDPPQVEPLHTGKAPMTAGLRTAVCILAVLRAPERECILVAG